MHGWFQIGPEIGEFEYQSDIFTPLGADPIYHWRDDDGPFSFFYYAGEQYQLYPTISNMRSVEAPEPSSLALMGIAVAALGFARLQKRKTL